MPQLDFITYSYQFHWLLLAFSFFYIFTLKYVFPSITSALKARAKKLLSDKKDLFNIETEEQKGLVVYETLWDKALKLKEKQMQYIQTAQTKISLTQTNK
jgi:F0F1-type ATP synthase membrane subunit b/b'